MSYINPNITNVISNGVQNLQAQMQAQNLQAQMQAQQAQNQMQWGQMQANVVETTYPEDPDLWSDDERLKMVVWFMKMHYEEDIKGFKAIRDIERSVERAEKDEEMRKYWERQHQSMQNNTITLGNGNYTTTATTGTWGANNALTATLRAMVDDLPLSKEPKKESWWKKLWK